MQHILRNKSKGRKGRIPGPQRSNSPGKSVEKPERPVVLGITEIGRYLYLRNCDWNLDWSRPEAWRLD